MSRKQQPSLPADPPITLVGKRAVIVEDEGIALMQ